MLLCCAMLFWAAPQVHELQALRQQLEPEVDIPQLQPLRDEVERLDQLLASLHQLQVSTACCSLFAPRWGDDTLVVSLHTLHATIPIVCESAGLCITDTVSATECNQK